MEEFTVSGVKNAIKKHSVNVWIVLIVDFV